MEVKKCTIMNYMKTIDTTRIILGKAGYKDNLYMNYLKVYLKFSHSKLILNYGYFCPFL